MSQGEKEVTMREVARAAGVSQSTVSKALRQDPTIPKGTCERVARVAAQLGYRQNPLVSALMAQLHGKRTKHQSPVIVALGIKLPGKKLHQSPASEGFYEGARARAEALGYLVELHGVPPGASADNALARQLRFRGVVGVFVLPLPWGMHRIGWDFSAFASAALGRSLEDPRLHQVSPHHSANIIALHRELRSAGYQRIGLLITKSMSAQVEDGWVAGFQRLAYRGDRTVLPVLAIDMLTAEGVRDYLRSYQPDCLICQEVWELERLKRELGAELADLPVFMPGRIAQWGYGGVEERYETVGRIALDLVVSQIHANSHGVPPEPRTTLVTGEVAGIPVRNPQPAVT